MPSSKYPEISVPAVPRLETARLFLRPHDPTLDAPGAFAMRVHPAGTRFLSMLPPADVAAVRARLERTMLAADRGELLGWTIVLRETHEFAGLLGLVRIERVHARAELAYELTHAHWGKGLMREAVARVVEFGFDELGLHRVEIRTAPENTRSMRVAESLGFAREGHLRENERHALGHFEDTVVFGKLAPASTE